MKNLFLLLFSISLFSSTQVIAQDAGDRIIGIWEPSNGKARVKIEKIGTRYYGKIVWLKEPNDPETGKPKVDKNNPDEKLQNVPIKGYRLLKDFAFKSGDEWEGGTIYDPENGSTYDCVITMKDNNTLDIRGFIGISAFGRTDVWKRLQTQKK